MLALQLRLFFPLDGKLLVPKGIKPGQTAVIDGKTVRFVAAAPSTAAGGAQVSPIVFSP